MPQCDGGASPGCAIPKAQALLQRGGVKKPMVQVHGASAEAFAESRPLAQKLVNDPNNSIVVVVVADDGGGGDDYAGHDHGDRISAVLQSWTGSELSSWGSC
ncbi:unnamed protein product [Polarella glacialis]|uniref:Uncharacterized protein n=1 Tax=Polarella glacialis TaxID=89957 RepID=A0A813DG58_POLGL|nr:unnamed protein product [Polarella glacialis]